MWKIGNLLSLKSFGIYKSFGVTRIFWPKINKIINIKAYEEFRKYNHKVKSKEDLENYKIKNILIGDLIYDSYLKKKLYPTIDINSSEFKNFFLDSLKLFFYWENYFKYNTISSAVLYHSVYLSALPLRFSISKKIPTYIINIEKLYSLNAKRYFYGLEYLNYKKIFNSFSNRQKKKNLELGKMKLLNRFNGNLSSDMMYTSKTAFGKTTGKRVLKKTKRLKILIAPHSFSDTPHAFGNNFFPDHYEWLESLGKISNKTQYDWYIKCHPDYTSYFDNTISIVKKFVKKYPKIIYLNSNTSHNQIIRDGIDYVLTVYGTIAGEYPYFGVNSINASTHHTQANYNFTVNPKNTKEYLKILNNLKKPHKVNKKKQILEHHYMKYEYFNNRWFFNDLNKVKYSIKGYKNLNGIRLYKYWIDNFDPKLHKARYENIKEFVNSEKYVLTENSKRNN